MDVTIVKFPETRVAMLEHHGSPATEHDTVGKLVQWKLANQLLDPARHRHYGLHHLPHTLEPGQHRVDFCLSVDDKIPDNDLGIYETVIQACRCAVARDVGSRRDNQAVKYLVYDWLPASDENASGAPLIFHYVNVGPNVKDSEAITDVYLPLQQ